MSGKRTETAPEIFATPNASVQSPPSRPLPVGLRASSRIDGDAILTLRVEDARSEDALGLISDSQAALLQHLPPEEIFSLDMEALAAPNVTLFVARVDGLPMGCVALVDDTSYGEVKRLFVRPGARGRGLGVALMEALERYCREIGLLEIKLETSPALAAAVALYERLGYRACGAFGDYPVLDSSLFMAKELGRLPQGA